MENLPDEILVRIFSLLDHKSLSRLASSGRRFNFANADIFWKKHCAQIWGLDEKPATMENFSWHAIFKAYFADLGQYAEIYAQMKETWANIFEALRRKVPNLANDLQMTGCSEADLNRMTPKHEKLPLDFRCSYRICNGQALKQPGIFGWLDQACRESLCLLPMRHPLMRPWQAATSCNDRYNQFTFLNMAKCYTTASSRETGLSIALTRSLQPANSVIKNGSIVMYKCNDGVDAVYVIASSWSEYLADFLKHLPEYVVQRNSYHPFRNVRTLRTGSFWVDVKTAFLPGHPNRLAARNDPNSPDGGSGTFHFAYHITMHMDELADRAESCQLVSRFWEIIDADNNAETVEGDGVVGRHPVMRPGAQYSWQSQTYFTTRSGLMRGCFTMRRLNDVTAPPQLIRIECPEFRMQTPPVANIRMIANSFDRFGDDDEMDQGSWTPYRTLGGPREEIILRANSSTSCTCTCSND